MINYHRLLFEYNDGIGYNVKSIIGIVLVSLLGLLYIICFALWFIESSKYSKRREARSLRNNNDIISNQANDKDHKIQFDSSINQTNNLLNNHNLNNYISDDKPKYPSNDNISEYTNAVNNKIYGDKIHSILNNEEDYSSKLYEINNNVNTITVTDTSLDYANQPSDKESETVFNPIISNQSTNRKTNSTKYFAKYKNYLGFQSLFSDFSINQNISSNLDINMCHPLYIEDKSFDNILHKLNQILNDHLSNNLSNSQINQSNSYWISFNQINLNNQYNYQSIVDLLQINNNSMNKLTNPLPIGLDLHNCNLTTHQAVGIMKAFINNIFNILIVKLDLSNNLIDENLIIELYDWLISPQCVLEEVSFAHIKIESKGILLLTNWIRQSKTIMRLDLSNCSIDRLGCFFISSSLSNINFDNKIFQLIESTYSTIEQSAQLSSILSNYLNNYTNQPINRSLLYLNMSYNIISSGGGIDLAKALNDFVQLTYLDISYQLKSKKIGPIGTREFANTLRLNQSNLQTLKLARNEVCFEGCRHLASALLSNDKLTELDIGNVNYITIAGAMQLAQSIRYKPCNRLAWLTVGEYRLPISVLLGDKSISNKYLDHLDILSNDKKVHSKRKSLLDHKKDKQLAISVDDRYPLDSPTLRLVESPLHSPIDRSLNKSKSVRYIEVDDPLDNEDDKEIDSSTDKPLDKSTDSAIDNSIERSLDKSINIDTPTSRSKKMRRLTSKLHNIASGLGKDLVTNISELAHNIINPIKGLLPLDKEIDKEEEVLVYDSKYHSIYPTSLSIERVNNKIHSSEGLFASQSLHGMNDEMAVVIVTILSTLILTEYLGILLQMNYNLQYLQLNSYYIPIQVLKGNAIINSNSLRYIDLSNKQLISTDMIVISTLLSDNMTNYLCINVSNNNFADTEGENYLVSTLENNPAIHLDYNSWPPHLIFKDGYRTLASLHGLSASGVSIEPQRLEGWFYQGLTIVSTILFYVNVITDILSIQSFVNAPNIYHKDWVVIAIILLVLPTVLYSYNTIRNLIRYSIKDTIIQTLIVLFQLINIFQCYECVTMSMETTAYLDYKYVIGIYKSIPQTLLKLYIMFEVISVEVNIWVVTSIFLSIISITVIFIMLYDRKMARKLSMAPIIDQPFVAIAVAKLLSVTLGMGKDTEHVESFTNFDSFYTSHYVWAYIYQLLSLFSRIVSLSWLIARTDPNYQILIPFLCVYIRFSLLLIIDTTNFFSRSFFNNIILSISLVISDSAWISNRESTNSIEDIKYFRYIYLSLSMLTSIEIMICIIFTTYIQSNLYYIYSIHIYYIVLITLIFRWIVIFIWKLNIHFPELYNKSNKRKYKSMDQLSDTNVIGEAVEISKQTIEWTVDKLNRISFGWIPKISHSNLDHDDNDNSI